MKSLAAPIALVLLAGLTSDVLAQPAIRPVTAPKTPPTAGAQKQPPTTNQQRPTAKASYPAEALPPKIEPVSEEVEAILQEWEDKSSQIKSIQGQHRRHVYNLVFEVDKVASGKFYLETPDKGRIDIEGIKPEKNEKSARIGRSGKPCRLEEDRSEKWICNGDEVIVVNEEDKSYEVMPLPAEAKGKNIVNSPLPFLFGMKAEDAKRRFNITLKSQSKTSVFLIIKPRLPSDQQNYTEAWVVLDKTMYVPTAVKLFDPSGNMETVYSFEGIKVVKVTDRAPFIKPILEIWKNEKDPFHPYLKGYKLVLSAEEEPAPRGIQVDPKLNSQIPKTANQVRPQGAGTSPKGTNLK